MSTKISQEIIERCANFIKDTHGVYDEELARLELEDLERKGCLIEYGPYCMDCPCYQTKCPAFDWQKHHPEFANDELDQKIRARYKELNIFK